MIVGRESEHKLLDVCNGYVSHFLHYDNNGNDVDDSNNKCNNEREKEREMCYIGNRCHRYMQQERKLAYSYDLLLSCL